MTQGNRKEKHQVDRKENTSDQLLHNKSITHNIHAPVLRESCQSTWVCGNHTSWARRPFHKWNSHQASLSSSLYKQLQSLQSKHSVFPCTKGYQWRTCTEHPGCCRSPVVVYVHWFVVIVPAQHRWSVRPRLWRPRALKFLHIATMFMGEGPVPTTQKAAFIFLFVLVAVGQWSGQTWLYSCQDKGVLSPFTGGARLSWNS